MPNRRSLSLTVVVAAVIAVSALAYAVATPVAIHAQARILSTRCRATASSGWAFAKNIGSSGRNTSMPGVHAACGKRSTLTKSCALLLLSARFTLSFRQGLT